MMRRPASCSGRSIRSGESVGVWATKDAPAATCIATFQAEKAQLAKNRRPLAKLGGGVWQNPSIDLATNRILLCRRQSLPRPRRFGPPRTPLYGLAGFARSRHRQIRLPFPVHRPRRVGPRCCKPDGAGEREGQDGKTIPGVIMPARPVISNVHDRKDCSLIRFSEAMVAAGEHVGASHQGRRAHASRRQWRCRMVADRYRSGAVARLCDHLHQP